MKPTYVFDIETYPNMFLVKLMNIKSKHTVSFTMTADLRIDWVNLNGILSASTVISFNGNGYDMIMLSAVATGRFDNDALKRLNDYIFANKFSRSWEIAREWGFEMLNLDHIDLIEIAPGQGGLKQYGGRLHCKKMQDLPYDPNVPLTFEQMARVDEYCGNDLELTCALYWAVKEDIDTRIEMNAQYGTDMRSKSDAQIAEAAFKKLLGLSYQDSRRLVAQAQKPPGFTWAYTVPHFIRFQTPEMQAALQRVLDTRFTLTPTNQIEAPLLDGFELGFHGAVYRMGVGGLHSSEKSTVHRAGPDEEIVDVDAASFYPFIIRILGLYPAHIGPVFLQHYNGWIDTRIEHKRAKRKRKANTYKIKLNGSFGKTKEAHSILFDPVMFSQIVITGQLTLLMLIERQYLAGVQAIQANTDGVVFKCRKDQVPMRDAIVKQFEADTGFEMEYTHYLMLASRDVNSYMAFKPGNPIEVKTKGEYADDPTSRLSKNPANQICLEAMKAYIINGTPLEQTIRQCSDIRKFVTVRNVSGGGSWVKETIDATRVAEKRAVLERHLWAFNPTTKLWSDVFDGGINLTLDQAFKVVVSKQEREFIGKTVRWYYGAGQRGHICTPKGGMVAKSQGAKPCMELPDVLPPDIDYAWYVAEAQSMLRDLGINA